MGVTSLVSGAANNDRDAYPIGRSSVIFLAERQVMHDNPMVESASEYNISRILH